MLFLTSNKNRIVKPFNPYQKFYILDSDDLSLELFSGVDLKNSIGKVTYQNINYQNQILTWSAIPHGRYGNRHRLAILEDGYLMILNDDYVIEIYLFDTYCSINGEIRMAWSNRKEILVNFGFISEHVLLVQTDYSVYRFNLQNSTFTISYSNKVIEGYFVKSLKSGREIFKKLSLGVL